MSGDHQSEWLVQSGWPRQIPIDPDATPTHDLDIVVVHDLVAHHLTSWTQIEERIEKPLWLEDFLRQDIPRANVSSFSCSESVETELILSANGIKKLAIELLQSVCQIRRTEQRYGPILFVGYGFGGLIIKKALLLARNLRSTSPWDQIKISCSNLVFIGTAQRAADLRSWENIALSMISIFTRTRASPISKILQPFTAALAELSEEFSWVADQYRVVSFYEVEAISWLGTPVVDNYSSKLNSQHEESIVLDANHFTMLNPSEKSEDRLQLLSEITTSFADAALTNHYLQTAGEFHNEGLKNLLFLTQFDQHQRNMEIPSWHSETLSWILLDKTYLAWREYRDPCTLYLHGKSGIGKTVLSTFLRDAIRAPRSDRSSGVRVAYFSLTRAVKDESSKKEQGLISKPNSLLRPADCRVEVRKLLLSLLDQIIAIKDCPEFYNELAYLYSLWPWENDELWKLLRAALLSPSHQGAICVIDGIENCDPSLTRSLLDLVSRAAEREVSLKLVLTSQSPPNEKQTSLFVVNLDSAKEIMTDTKIAIRTEMASLVQDRGASLETENDILEKLFCKDLTHLDIHLVFRYLRGLTRLSSLSAIRGEPEAPMVNLGDLTPSTLMSLGKELDSLLNDQLGVSEYVCSNLWLYPSWIVTALSWILWSFRPLTINELAVAVTLANSGASYSEIDEIVPRDFARDLLLAAGPLLRTSSETVFLVHESIRKNLIERMAQLYPNASMLNAPHDHFAKVCLHYLSTIDADDSVSGWIQDPVAVDRRPSKPRFLFLDYASAYWPSHFLQAEAKSALCSGVWAFLTDSKRFALWNRFRYSRGVLAPRGISAEDASPLFTAVEIQSIEFVNKALGEYGDVGEVDDEDDNGSPMNAALDLASTEGLYEIANILVRSGRSSINALRLAAQYGHFDLVKEFLRQGVTVHDEDGAYEFALLAAVKTGQEAIFDVLLEAASREDLARFSDIPNFFGGESVPIVQKLLQLAKAVEKPVDITEALNSSIGAGHLDVARDLIRTYSTSTDDEETLYAALSSAADSGQIVLVRELLQAIKISNPVGRYASTPIHLAALKGHAQVVEELAQAGSDPNAVSLDDGRTPLHCAATGGHLEATRSLLRLGSSSSISDSSHSTPLHIAAGMGHLLVVQVLLDHNSTQKQGEPVDEPKDNSRSDSPSGSDDDTQDSDSIKFFDETTPLHLAVAGGYVEIVKALLGASADVTAKDGTRRTPVHIACKFGQFTILKLLLAAGSDTEGATDMNAIDDKRLTCLHLASEKGKLSIVKILLSQSADVNASSYENETPLLIASLNGHVELVKVFLESGADLEATDDSHSNALLLAASKGHSEVVSVLIDAGCNVGVTNESGDAPLHVAVRARAIDTVELLLAHDAELELKGRNGWTPLHYAVPGPIEEPSLRLVDLLDLLLRKGGNVHAVNNLGSTALMLAAEVGSEDAVASLLGAGADVNAANRNGSCPIHRAARGGHPGIMQLLIDAGADPLLKKGNGKSPFGLALSNNHFGTIDVLLDHIPLNSLPMEEYDEALLKIAQVGRDGVLRKLLKLDNINIEAKDDVWGQSALSLAAENGRDSTVKLLLEVPGVNVDSGDKSGRSPISWACLNDHVTVVRLLLEHGADISLGDDRGWSSLHLSMPDGDKEMVELLLDHGADVSAQLGSGAPALNLAIEYGHDSIVKLLLERGADASTPDMYGWTPLHLATQEVNEEIVKMLLEHGADVSAALTKTSRTALHIAAKANSQGVLKSLHEKGSSLSSRTNLQLAPLDLAVIQGHTEMVKLLLDLGADLFALSLDGWTSLKHAIMYSQDECAEIILDVGGDALAEHQPEKWAPLHIAALCGKVEMVRGLLEEGVDVDLRDAENMTPIHWATIGCREDVVALLLEKGADLTIRGSQKKSVLHVAAAGCDESIVRALMAAGADKNAKDEFDWTPFHFAWMSLDTGTCNILSGSSAATESLKMKIETGPSRWVKPFESSRIMIAGDGLTSSSENLTPWELHARTQIRTDAPIPAGSYTYYFEITIGKAGKDSMIGIGITWLTVRAIGMPGWHRRSFAYHGDDGNKFIEDSSGEDYGPTYGMGDVVGCGVDLANHAVFFTKNGKKLGTATTDVKGRWYPVVGFGNPDIEIKANFGPGNFKYDENAVEVEEESETGDEAPSDVGSKTASRDEVESVASEDSAESY